MQNQTNIPPAFFANLLIAFRVLSIVVTILALVINLFFSIYIMTRKTLRNPSNIFIASMNISCIIQAFTFILPITIFRGTNIPTVCIIFLPLGEASAVLVNIHACFICIEHYVYIVHPFRYQRFVTINKVIAFIIIMWLTVISMTYSFHIILNNLECPDWTADISRQMGRVIGTTVLASVMVGLPLITMIITYLRLHRFIRYHLNRIDCQIDEYRRDLVSAKNRKALHRMLLLLGNFAFCWLPALITTTLIFKLGYSSPTLIAARNISYIFSFSYSIVGPIGYVSCCPDIVKNLRRFWRHHRQRTTGHVLTSTQ